MPRVFISFRKADDRWMRDRVYQALISRYEASQFFKSGTSIVPGTEFSPVLLHQAQECEIMLVLIGSRWLDASDDHGRRLLDRDDDWVRREIATSIAAGNRVVPVLLGDSTMLPGPSQLPPDIAKIGRLQFLRIPETYLEVELGNLLTMLCLLLPDLAAAPPSDDEQSGKAVGSDPAVIPERRGATMIGDRHIFIGRDNSGNVSAGDNTTNVQLR